MGTIIWVNEVFKLIKTVHKLKFHLPAGKRCLALLTA
jgi:hypothetical protein